MSNFIFQCTCGSILLPLSLGLALSQEWKPDSDRAKKMAPIVVKAEAEADETIQDPWLPAVVGAAIYSGKKSQVLDFDQLPRIVANNYRQALIQSPSLLLSEESTPLVSIGYRGLNPNRAQYTQMLRDGIPIHADQFGYPEAYYTPPLDTVDRIEFLHGGASLQYGPQPGGALNYITHRPRKDQTFSLRTQHVIGSDDLYSTFTSADGTVGDLGYYTYFNHRQGNGFRSANSDYDLNNGSVKFTYDLDNGATLIGLLDRYRETHGEPGGLSRADFFAGKRQANRLHDFMTIERDSMSLTYEMAARADSFFTATLWWSDYNRFSMRQRGGGFGTLPSGVNAASTTIEEQQFGTVGLDARYRFQWGPQQQHAFSAGAQMYHNDSPRRDERGASATATTGALRNQSQREVLYAPIFVENRWAWGSFSLTPGLRVENAWQDVRELANADKNSAGTPLGRRDAESHVVLGGIGAEYTLEPGTALYANVSQGYRPVIFSEAVPTGGTTFVNQDIEEGKSLEYEIGLRSHPHDWLSYDVSAFLLQFNDQIGSVAVPGGTSVENVGDSVHQGVDASVQVDLLHLVRGVASEERLEWFVNSTIMNAEFTAGPRQGKTPQYAADLILRSGLTFTPNPHQKFTLSSTWVDDYHADDANTPNYAVPAYNVWDLTAEFQVHRHVRLLAGINNLLDEDYFSRVTASGIDPANGRNVYAGVSLEF